MIDLFLTNNYELHLFLVFQTAYSQQCGCSSNYGSQIVSPVSLGSLGYGVNVGSGCGGNLGYSGVSLGNSGVNYGSSNLGSVYPLGVEALALATGSSVAPGSICVNADNLEIGGQLIVTGQLPVIGTIAVSGEVPTGGQAQIQYSTAPGVGLTNGGCGYGLASNVPNVVYGNTGVVGNMAYGNTGLIGNSGLGVVVNNGLGVNSGLVGLGGLSLGCGCGL